MPAHPQKEVGREGGKNGGLTSLAFTFLCAFPVTNKMKKLNLAEENYSHKRWFDIRVQKFYTYIIFMGIY